MKRLVSLMAAAVLALSLTSCSSDSPTVTKPSDSAAEETPGGDDSSADDTADDDTGGEDPASSSDPVFGDTVTYDDGMEITVGKPKKFTPSEYAAGADGDGTPMKFTITVKNGTDKAFDPTLVYATASSGGEESESIFDTDAKLGMSPQTALKPGKSVKWDVGFMIADPKDITLEVALNDDFSRDSAVYSN
ncbi:hypothetical protein [Cellulomonas sp. PhB150]|uniref:hypothetical protein n=1 Tax=Cellulomonas sp. PhB150 TaxID=2485188 RepID=UPI000FA0E838|nr:hypothetical protein [Cellulomonas sp. PhB150]ROS23800.1 hypothetical protein EDF34_2861 [Cellulomonas sp. PhB150]